jgi:predicted PurR-regulated permease PerM
MMGESAPIQRWVQLAGYTLIIGAALTVLSPFLVPLAWAAILAFATWRVYERVRRRLGERSGLAAALMTALVVLLIVIPAGLLSLALAAEAGRTFADFRLSALTLPAWVPATLRELPWFGPRLADQLVRALADSSALERWILANAGGWAAAVATAAGNVGRNALDAVLALLTLFFLYRDGHVLVPQIQRALHRLGGERFAVMFDPLGETIRAVMYGTLFTALSQGFLAMLGYWAAGLRAPVLLGALTALLALTPIGAALVYVSAGVWLLIDGRLAAGGLLLAWGVLVISLVDNVIRSWFLRGAVRVPFLLGFFGVLGGIAAFGAVGIFLGPIAIALLLALWREWAAAT